MPAQNTTAVIRVSRQTQIPQARGRAKSERMNPEEEGKLTELVIIYLTMRPVVRVPSFLYSPCSGVVPNGTSKT